MRATTQMRGAVLGSRRGILVLLATVTVAAAVLVPTVAGNAAHSAAGAPVTGGGTSATLNLHSASALTLALSPDHQTIAMNFLGNVWTLPTRGGKGGKATRVTSLLQDTAYPDWSPDGKTIAFQSYRSGTFHIWAMNPDGSNVRELTSGYYDDREPQFSPDGTQIAFSSDRPPIGSPPGIATGSYNIWVLTLATGELTEITHASSGPNDYYPTWSPDGKQITFVDTTHAIESVAASGQGPVTTLYSNSADTFYSPTWSPDGKSLAYTALVNGGTLTQLFVNGQPVSGNEDVFAFPARWASNDTLIYAANGKIRQRNLTSGAVTTIPFSAAVSFNRASYPLKPHDFDSTAKQPVTGILTPELSPDGRHVVFVALNQLWEMTIGKRPRRLTDDPFAKATPVWSPDGEYLAYSSDRDGPMAIYIRNMDTGHTRRLTAPFTGAQVKLAWSPDGNHIAFETALDNEAGSQALYVADFPSGQFRQIFGPQNATGAAYEIAFEPGTPTWGPDSNTIALAVQQSYSTRFREGTSEILTVNATTGATQMYDPYPYQTLTNRVEGDGPVWSPDGKYMAYVLDDVLWILPVTPGGAPAGPPRQLTDEVADQISWSGDSQHILYDSAGTLRMISVDGGSPTAVPVRLSWRPRATPAGEKVIHAGTLWAGTSGSLQRNVDIVVRGNRILSVGPARPRSSYGPDIRYIDASSETVIPGLWDAHVHEGMDQPFAGDRQDRLELAMGVTSEMSMGDEPYRALTQVESQESGATLGPRYFWAAEPIDGRRIFYSWMRADPDMSALGRDLSRIAELNPDILKTYVRLPNSYENIAIAAGHELGLPSFSHYFWPALAFGQDGTAHWATQRLGYQIAVSNNTVAYNDTIQLYARSGMSITNTPFFGVQYLTTVNGQPILSDPRLRTLLSPWQYAAAEQEYAAPPLSPALEQTLRGWTGADAKILAAGGTVLGGTDNPIGFGNFGTVVAVSVMAHTGLSNYQALRAFTVEPAKIMGLSNQLGTIQPGMIADMDIIKGNPLQNIETIANDAYVMQNGRLFTEQELLGPYANVQLNTPPSSGATAAVARAEASTLSYGRVKWLATTAELGRLQRLAALLCHLPN
ncbi:MAG: PD40 domain-containing protein [Solirubrobacterales bacterium]|nr:PD40 domain-containing protein [Solirubrobacterales bacterium]